MQQGSALHKRYLLNIPEQGDYPCSIWQIPKRERPRSWHIAIEIAVLYISLTTKGIGGMERCMRIWWTGSTIRLKE